MVTTTQKAPATGQQGFTLVELAIVLVIVGLLIGGILKGQELIASTRINSSVSQVKAIETATATFVDTYGAFPGDMLNPTNRLTNCAAAPCAPTTAGDGNGRLGRTPSVAYDATNSTENEAYFHQLFAAGLISGITGQANNIFGQGLMASVLSTGIGIRVGYAAAIADLAGATNPNLQQGHYLALSGIGAGVGAISAAADDNSNGLTPKQAENIDRKYDDAQPQSGSVMASTQATGASATANCTATAQLYNGQNPERDCSLFIRVAN